MAQLFSLGIVRHTTMNPVITDASSRSEEIRPLSEKECFDRLAVLIKEKEAKRYAWFRHLLLLSSGGMTVLVSLRGTSPIGCLPHLCMAAGVVSLGLGILSGAVALHGEVWTARDLVVQMGQYSKKIQEHPSEPFPGILSNNPKRYRVAEWLFYIFLVIAVLALVVYAIVSK